MLSSIPPPETVFHTIRIDHVGPLPTMAGGNRYIIVAVDYLSKHVEVAAVPSLAASHVIDFLQAKFEWRHGMPKVISDHATTFRSHQLRPFLRQAPVEHHFSSPYHPQANGLTEKTNQNIQARLAPYVKTNKAAEADWDKDLQSAAY